MVYLIIPSIGTCPDLLTRQKAVCPTQKVVAEISETIGRRIVETDNKKGVVDYIETSLVVPVPGKHHTKT